MRKGEAAIVSDCSIDELRSVPGTDLVSALCVRRKPGFRRFYVSGVSTLSVITHAKLLLGLPAVISHALFLACCAVSTFSPRTVDQASDRDVRYQHSLLAKLRHL